MKKFDLEAAKAGAKVCTRDGHAARIVEFHMKSIYPIVALVMDEYEEESPASYLEDGRYIEDVDNDEDLMMVE